MLVTSKNRTIVFFLFFLGLKYAWKTKGQTTKGLKDSDLNVHTHRKKRSTQPKKAEGTKEECKTVTEYIAYLPKFNSESSKVYFDSLRQEGNFSFKKKHLQLEYRRGSVSILQCFNILAKTLKKFEYNNSSCALFSHKI